MGKDMRRLCRVTTLLGGGIVLFAVGEGPLGSVLTVLRRWACLALLAVCIKFPSTILGVSRAKSPYQKLTVLFEMNSLPQKISKTM